ncbi:MAG: hypothetical protein P4N24_07045, partial [Acidobacteriota bacterium]|nr:hypothetical protein [Acidobacteriota bacterium]
MAPAAGDREKAPRDRIEEGGTPAGGADVRVLCVGRRSFVGPGGLHAGRGSSEVRALQRPSAALRP